MINLSVRGRKLTNYAVFTATTNKTIYMIHEKEFTSIIFRVFITIGHIAEIQIIPCHIISVMSIEERFLDLDGEYDV